MKYTKVEETMVCRNAVDHVRRRAAWFLKGDDAVKIGSGNLNF